MNTKAELNVNQGYPFSIDDYEFVLKQIQQSGRSILQKNTGYIGNIADGDIKVVEGFEWLQGVNNFDSIVTPGLLYYQGLLLVMREPKAFPIAVSSNNVCIAVNLTNQQIMWGDGQNRNTFVVHAVEARVKTGSGIELDINNLTRLKSRLPITLESDFFAELGNQGYDDHPFIYLISRTHKRLKAIVSYAGSNTSGITKIAGLVGSNHAYVDHWRPVTVIRGSNAIVGNVVVRSTGDVEFLGDLQTSDVIHIDIEYHSIAF